MNSRSAGSFISDVAPRRVGDDDRVGDRVDDQVQAVALGARLHFGDAHLAVVLFDLSLARRRSVTLRRIETTPLPCRGSSVTVLSSSNTRSEPSTGLTSSSSRRVAPVSSIALLDSADDSSMLFMRTAPRRPSLSSSDAVNSVSARAFAISSRPSVSVEQNRVGDGVDDAVEQRPLAPLLAIAVGQRLLPEDLIELLAEDGGEPVQLRAERGAAAEQQQAEGFFGEAGRRRAATRETPNPRTAWSAGACGRRPECGAGKNSSLRLAKRGDERIAPVLERHVKAA